VALCFKIADAIILKVTKTQYSFIYIQCLTP